ncbi:MAG: hypothetical protein AAF840_01740 [Bacteroidota bacterium]
MPTRYTRRLDGRRHNALRSMISVLQQPDSVQLSGNPIDFEVLASRSDGSPAISTGGVRAILTDDNGNGLNDNTFISLNWRTPEGVSRSVNFHTSGSFAAAYQIPAYVSGPLVNYWSALAQTINNNQEVSPFFTVTWQRNSAGNYTLIAAARSLDPAWSVGWGPAASSNFSVLNDQTGNEDLGFRIRVSVFLKVDGIFQSLGEFGGSPNAQSRYSFDISNMIDGAIRNALPVPGIPSFTADAPILGTNLFDYYVRITDYTTTDGYGAGVLIEGKQAFAGRVGGTLQGVNFIETITAANSWLCSRPDRRTIGREEPVFLSHLKPGPGSASLTLQVEEFDQNGTGGVIRSVYQNTAVEGRTPVTFPVGVAALGIDAGTLYYRVRVASATDDNPWRTFIIDQRTYEEERYLIYLNSFFLPEVFRCTGEISQDLEVSYSTYSRVRPLNGGRTEPGKGNWSTDTTDGYLFATGYKPKAEISAMIRELVESPRVYEFRSTGSIPLLPNGRNFSLGSTDQNLFAATLSFELAELEKGSAFGSVGDSVGGGTDTGGGIIDPPTGGDGEGGAENIDNWTGDDNVAWTGDDDVAWAND